MGIIANLVNYQLIIVPSSEALYPIETYVCVHNVEDTPRKNLSSQYEDLDSGGFENRRLSGKSPSGFMRTVHDYKVLL